MIELLGFMFLIIGSAGMDNHSLTVPVIMVLIGLTLIVVSAYEAGVFETKK